jgi:hypothetical protein
VTVNNNNNSNNNNNNNNNRDDSPRNIAPLRTPIDHCSLRFIPYRAVNTFSVDRYKSENVVFRDVVHMLGKRVVYSPNIIRFHDKCIYFWLRP